VQVLCAERAETAGRAEPAARAEPAPGRSGRPAEAPVINTETLGHLEELGSSAAFVENLIGVFVADSAALLERIDRALAGRNYGEFRALLHAMKGSSASMGAERLTRICGSLDKLSDSEIRLQSPGLLRAIGDELDAARTALERHARSRRQSAS
jgi:two-component system sensor histidine kinase RpfC